MGGIGQRAANYVVLPESNESAACESCVQWEGIRTWGQAQCSVQAVTVTRLS